MEITKIIRLVVGGAGILITTFLLYLVWRLYTYFYTDIEPGQEMNQPAEPHKESYNAPRYVYNNLTHEFYVTGE